MDFSEFLSRFHLIEGTAQVFDAKHSVVLPCSVLKKEYPEHFEKWKNHPERNSADNTVFNFKPAFRPSIVEKHSKGDAVKAMCDSEYSELVRLLHEINWRLLGRSYSSTRRNIKQPESIKMGGVYWRLSKIKQIVDSNLENFETKEHADFLRKNHKF